MNDFIYKLPFFFILSMLVVIFGFLRKQHPSARFRLWLIAWLLIFARMVLELGGMALGIPHKLLMALDLALVQAAGVIFLVSVSAVIAVPRARNLLILILAAPSTVYAFLMCYGVESWFLYLALLLLPVIGGSTITAAKAKRSSWSKGIIGFTLLAGAISAGAAAQGRPDIGFYVLMSATFGLTGLLFYRTYKRLTPGILTTAMGFIVLAIVYPLVYLLWPGEMGLLQSNICNVPKFVVAVGMIVTLLEDERIAVEVSRFREQYINVQLQRFSEVTSFLLSGVNAPIFCDEVARAITEASNFQRAVIILADDERRLRVAGRSGVEEKDVQHIQGGLDHFTMDSLSELCVPERRIGKNSFRIRTEQMINVGAIPTSIKFEPNPYWSEGDDILLPLRGPSGNYVGVISLDDPKVVERVTPEDFSALEILAGDLAVAIENANLQKHLVRSEKLAGVGQLVSGVAHELNNPLAAILGYTELMADKIREEDNQRDLRNLRREALRMKKIIEDLLRFSRQSKVERRPVELAAILEDVIKLRNYEIRNRNIDVVFDFDPDLPRVVLDDVLIKQVFLNVLNNAMDAVEVSATKRIVVEGRARGPLVRLRVMDSGMGFKEVHRVFDPFFTTKGPGRGTGLGLSICYGIIKDHSGEITASNLAEGGACITIELPAEGSSDTAAATDGDAASGDRAL